MARIRTIKPEFFTNAKVLKLTPLARLFYVSLWCEADRLGRLKWDAETLKYRYLPKDDVEVEDLGAELVKAKLIRLYAINGDTYADIPGFIEHQVINNRESESSIPPYSDDACVTRESGDTDAAYGKEGRKGKEGTTPIVPKGTVYPQDFESFWTLYPHKVGKDAALNAWKKRQKLGDLPSLPLLTEAIGRYIDTKPIERDYCNPSTWINQGRWLDQFATTAPTPTVTLPSKTEEEWRSALRRFKRDEYWPLSGYGPQPGYGGCIVPTSLLAEFGLALGAA